MLAFIIQYVECVLEFAVVKHKWPLDLGCVFVGGEGMVAHFSLPPPIYNLGIRSVCACLALVYIIILYILQFIIVYCDSILIVVQASSYRTLHLYFVRYCEVHSNPVL